MLAPRCRYISRLGAQCHDAGYTPTATPFACQRHSSTRSNTHQPCGSPHRRSRRSAARHHDGVLQLLLMLPEVFDCRRHRVAPAISGMEGIPPSYRLNRSRPSGATHAAHLARGRCGHSAIVETTHLRFILAMLHQQLCRMFMHFLKNVSFISYLQNTCHVAQNLWQAFLERILFNSNLKILTTFPRTCNTNSLLERCALVFNTNPRFSSLTTLTFRHRASYI